MPTYDYRCKACEHAFELVQSMTAPVKRKCPECGRLTLERLIGAGAGFIIKGSAAPPATGASSSSESPDPESKGDGASAGDTSSTDSSASDSPTDTKAPADPPPEKKVSGSTSTPTHAAREGRGVGNLVDAARRRSREQGGTSSTGKKKSRTKKPRKGPSDASDQS